jgi:predicted neuraminidase
MPAHRKQESDSGWIRAWEKRSERVKAGHIRASGAAVIVAVSLWAAWPGLYPAPAPGFVPPMPIRTAPGEPPRLFSTLISTTLTREVHAASLAERADGRLLAVWFGGTREGSADVRIYGVEGVPDADGDTRWNEPKAIVSREETGQSQGRWIRKLGNPVVFADAGHALWLAYASATLSGWASSRLNLSRLSGDKPSASSGLVTSPFFNMSTLVKGSPAPFDNGDLGLPVYHELAGKFAELLVLTPEGKVRRKIRMDQGRRALQPVLLVEDARHAVALMRDAGGNPPRVWRSETADAGRNWSEPQSTDLNNPNSALAALRLDDGRLLAVANDTEDERLRLSLLVSEDRGHHWRVLHRFEDRQAAFDEPLTEAAFYAQLSADIATLAPTQMETADIIAAVMKNACSSEGECQWQYDYPYLIRADDGDFHLVYSWNRSFIRYVRFNTAWLRERLEEGA